MRAIVLLLSAALCCGSVQAQVPNLINYQGYLTNPGGAPVTASLSMEFKLYNVPSGGIELFAETQMVSVSSGVFNVLIRSVTPLPLAFDVPYWLGVTVDTDAEMTPRQTVAASPYALTAEALAPGSNLTLNHPSTAVDGNIMKGANRFIHNFGVSNTFVGENAGNFSMSGDANVGMGTGRSSPASAG